MCNPQPPKSKSQKLLSLLQSFLKLLLLFLLLYCYHYNYYRYYNHALITIFKIFFYFFSYSPYSLSNESLYRRLLDITIALYCVGSMVSMTFALARFRLNVRVVGMSGCSAFHMRE